MIQQIGKITTKLANDPYVDFGVEVME